MPLFMDVHRNAKGISKEALEEAHQKDLAVQDKYGVKYHKYWYSEEQEAVFCLCDAPDKESAEAVHKEAHGDIADEIYKVQEGR